MFVSYKSKKWRSIIIFLLFIAGIAGCGGATAPLPDVSVIIREVFEIQTQKEEDTDTQKTQENIPAIIMVNGRLYYDTGTESGMEFRCGNMDGQIISSVPSTQIPSEDGQTNFGYVGNGFQYGTTGTIEVYMDNSWRVFELREVWMTVIEFSNNMLTILIGNRSGQEYIFDRKFILEQENSAGEWEPVLFSEGYGWVDSKYVLPDAETMELQLDMSGFGVLAPGRYRICKNVMSAEFIVWQEVFP